MKKKSRVSSPPLSSNQDGLVADEDKDEDEDESDDDEDDPLTANITTHPPQALD